MYDLKIDPDAILEASEGFDKVGFKSNFSHLMDHNGFRCGELHNLIGPKGGGKSSLVRTWLLETLLQGKKPFLHLSEETPEKYLVPIYRALRNVLKDDFKAKDFLNNISVQSEKSFDNQYQKIELVDKLEYRVRETGSDIVFHDNFTTSIMSLQGVSKEAEYAHKMSHLAEKLNKPIIVLSHTAKQFKNTTYATGEDVRGNATLPNTASVVYVINSLLSHPEKPSFVLVDKSRYHSKANKQVYRIQYDSKDGIFYSDARSSFQAMADYWKVKKERR